MEISALSLSLLPETLYSKLEVNGNEAFVSFSANGGSTKELPASVLTQKGETITLPQYTGSRNGFNFMGWALVSSVKTNVYYKIYQQTAISARTL